MRYKVLYHIGDEVDLKTKAKTGRLALEDGRLSIDSDQPLVIPLEALQAVTLFRMHGLGRMLRVEHAGGRLFVTVIRFSIGDMFAVVNFVGTGRLRDELQAAMGPHT